MWHLFKISLPNSSSQLFLSYTLSLLINFPCLPFPSLNEPLGVGTWKLLPPQKLPFPPKNDVPFSHPEIPATVVCFLCSWSLVSCGVNLWNFCRYIHVVMFNKVGDPRSISLFAVELCLPFVVFNLFFKRIDICDVWDRNQRAHSRRPQHAHTKAPFKWLTRVICIQTILIVSSITTEILLQSELGLKLLKALIKLCPLEDIAWTSHRHDTLL